MIGVFKCEGCGESVFRQVEIDKDYTIGILLDRAPTSLSVAVTMTNEDGTTDTAVVEIPEEHLIAPNPILLEPVFVRVSASEED